VSTRVTTGQEAAVRAATGDTVANLQLTIADHLVEIAALFKPGVKLTLIARTPTHPDGSRDVVVTDDNVSSVIRALELRET